MTKNNHRQKWQKGTFVPIEYSVLFRLNGYVIAYNIAYYVGHVFERICSMKCLPTLNLRS